MKKGLALIVLAILCVVICTVLSACNEEQQNDTNDNEYNETASEGLEYTLSEDETYYSVSGIGTFSGSNLIIPNEYNNLPVKVIGNSAFKNCDILESVTFKNGIEFIGGSAFYNCTSLENVSIPNSVKGIGRTSFSHCPAEKNEGGLYYVDKWVTLAAQDITSVAIKNGTIGIAEKAFVSSDVEYIDIPNSIKYINESAFRLSYAAGIIDPPLEKINYLGKIDDWCGIVFSDEGSNPCVTGAKLYIKNNLVSTIEIPSTITRINDYAFFGCSSLISVTIPDNVTSIGNYVFEDCRSLTSITIADSITFIGWYTFKGCNSLTIYCEATNRPSSWDEYWNYPNCPVYWYSESEPTAEGNYWHYVDGEVVVWE